MTLGEILGSGELQAEVAARSYRHPNGYLKLVLTEGRGGPGASSRRLHVWTGGEDGGSADVHGHAWEYRSQVVAGTLAEVTYVELGEADGAGWAVWRHSYAAAGDLRHSLGDPERVRLSRVGSRILGPGATVRGAPERIHRFWAVETPAVTLLEVGPWLRESSPVYLENLKIGETVMTHARVTPEEVAEWVGFALVRLMP